MRIDKGAVAAVFVGMIVILCTVWIASSGTHSAANYSQESNLRITVLTGERLLHYQATEWSYTSEGLLKFTTLGGEHRIVRGDFIISFRDKGK
jgi:hypothetical protein